MNLKDGRNKLYYLKNLLDPGYIEKRRAEERRRGLAKGLALGAVIGGVLGIFFAPDSGKNTRKKTKEELERVKESLASNFEEIKQSIGCNLADNKEKLTEIYEDKKGLLAEKIIEVKEKFNKERKAAIEKNHVETEDDEENPEDGGKNIQ